MILYNWVAIAPEKLCPQHDVAFHYLEYTVGEFPSIISVVGVTSPEHSTASYFPLQCQQELPQWLSSYKHSSGFTYISPCTNKDDKESSRMSQANISTQHRIPIFYLTTRTQFLSSTVFAWQKL